MHIPLADSPQDGTKRGSKTTIPLSGPGAEQRQGGVSGGEILKTTTVDVERGFAGW